jgi:hypothetical protein
MAYRSRCAGVPSRPTCRIMCPDTWRSMRALSSPTPKSPVQSHAKPPMR